MSEEQEEQSVRIVLTPEQRELVRRMSGQNFDVIDISPEDAKRGGGSLRFGWRLSVASGIPRLGWTEGDADAPPEKKPE